MAEDQGLKLLHPWDCPFMVIFLAIIRPHAFLEMIEAGMRSGFPFFRG